MNLVRLESYALLFGFEEGYGDEGQSPIAITPLCSSVSSVVNGFESSSTIENTEELSRKHLIEQLLHCAFRFQYGKAMVHRTREISVRKCNPAERASS